MNLNSKGVFRRTAVIRNYNHKMSYKETEAYHAHERLGFPSIEDEIQLEMLTSQNFQPIMNLCPDINTFPFGLLNEYITITKKQLKDYLVRINYIDSQLKSFSATYDGFWLKRNEGRYVIIERERGQEFNQIFLDSLDDVLNLYVNQLGNWCK